MRDNLTFETSPLQIKDREVKHLRDKEIDLVKVLWGRPAGGSVMWELESQMKDSYLELFPSGNFLGRKFFKWGTIITLRF